MFSNKTFPLLNFKGYIMVENNLLAEATLKKYKKYS